VSILLLFSSNQRPLYEQDIIDVLAAPESSRYTFRYEKRYVDDSASKQWTSLASTPVLVFFSIQQEAYYQPPAYIPVRRGRVVAARSEGDICLVEFELGRIVSLPLPVVEDDPTASSRPGIAARRPIYEDPVRELAGEIAKVPSPGFERKKGRKSASLVAENAVPIVNLSEIPPYKSGGPLLIESADQVAAFKSATDYLSHTASFSTTQFLRFYNLADRRTGNPVQMVDGVFRLSDNSDYELELLQMQPREVGSRVTFAIGSAEEVLKVIGVPEFDIASRYDLVKVPLHVPPLAEELRETVLTVAPKSPDIKGSHLNLRLQIRRHPSPVTAAGAAGLLLLAGLPGAFGDVPKMAVVALGAVIAFALFYYGWVRVTSPRA